MNLALILNILHQYAPISRADLSKVTGLNKATVTSIIRELMEASIVIESGNKHELPEVGHPSIDLRINPNAGRVIGAEIGDDCISAVITDLTPKILWRTVDNIIDCKENLDSALAWPGKKCQITVAKYKNDACVIGAVATVFWNILNNPEKARRSFYTEK